MFNHSVSVSRFAAGSGIDQVESRVKRLEMMIQTMDQKRQDVSTVSPDLTGGVSFKSFLGNTTPPPKVMPLAGSVKEISQNLQPVIQKYAQQYGVDAKLIQAIIRQESGFNPNAVSSAGAQGLMQLMPETARSLGVQNSFDPEQNIEGGVRFFASLMKKYRGNAALALAAYNAGGGAVDKYNGVPPYKETQLYVRKVLAAYLSSQPQV